MAVDTWNIDVRAGRLVQIDFLTKTLCATFIESLALNWLVVAGDIMLLHLRVAHGDTTAKVNIFALKLH